MNKENYIFVGLFLVVGAGLGLLASIIYENNIPLSLTFGAVIGVVIGSITDFLLSKIKKN